MGPDIGLIIAITGSAIAIVGVVVAMMFWSRTEANSLRHEAKEDRRDLIGLNRNLESSFSIFIEKSEKASSEFRERSEKAMNDHRKEMSDISKNMDKTLYAIQLDLKEYHRDLLELQKKVG